MSVTLRDLERAFRIHAVGACVRANQGSRVEAAKVLGVSRAFVYRHLPVRAKPGASPASPTR